MLCYIAYPTSLSLQSANALQTYATLRELRVRRPDTLAIIARWGRGASRFEEVGAWHLPRPAIGKLSRLYRSTLWYYLEYTTFAWMCAPIVAAHPVDAIYVRQNICAAWWSAVIGPRLGIPVIYEAHDIELHNPSRAREPWAQGLLHLIDHAALTRSDAVVSLTDDFRRYLNHIGWRCPDEVAIIPDAYDDRIFRPQPQAQCREELGIAADARVVAYAGMTFAHRWLDGLLDATARLVPHHPTIHLVLVGGRPAEIEALQQKAAAQGLHHHVTLVGPTSQDNVVRYLGAADVLVIPDTVTDVTASPLKLFEYLALGHPLVLPDIPALHEIVPTELAHYFPRRHLDGLATALHHALIQAQASERTLLGSEQRRKLALEHTYGRRAERILTVVDGVRGV